MGVLPVPVFILLVSKVQEWCLREPQCREVAVADTGIFLQRRENPVPEIRLRTLKTSDENQRRSAEISHLHIWTGKTVDAIQCVRID